MNNLRDNQPLQHIAGLAGGIQETVRQLEGLSRLIADRIPTVGDEPEIESRHVGPAMALFAQQLNVIHDVLDDIIGTAEDAGITTLQAVKG